MAGAYKAACEAAQARHLISANDCFNSGFPELTLNGHRTVELLNERLVDLDVAPLAVAVAESKQFALIDFSYNELGAGAAESLAQLLKDDSTIEMLDLSENNLTAEAVEVLCSALNTNSTLRELRLSGNALGTSGGMAVAKMLHANSGLRKLALSNCGLSTEALVALATVLREDSKLVELDVGRPLTRTLMDEPASHLGRMLKLNGHLETLDLSKAGLTDSGLRLLAEGAYRGGDRSALAVLRLRANALELADNDVLNALHLFLASPHCRLVELDVGANRLADEGGLKLADLLGSNGSLRIVDGAHNRLGSRGLCALAAATRAHPALRTLRLWGNYFDSAACLSWTEALGTLRALDLDFTPTAVDGVYQCVENR